MRNHGRVDPIPISNCRILRRCDQYLCFTYIGGAIGLRNRDQCDPDGLLCPVATVRVAYRDRSDSGRTCGDETGIWHERLSGDRSVPGYVRSVHWLCRHFRHDHRPQQEQHWRNILWNILFPWSIILAMGDGIRIMSSHELLRRQADLHGAKSNRLTFRFVRNCRYVTPLIDVYSEPR